MIELVLNRVGSKKKIVELRGAEWAYWTWSPTGDENERYEYVVVPTPRGAIVGNRPNWRHPFYPFAIEGTSIGQGVGAYGLTESFRVRVIKDL